MGDVVLGVIADVHGNRLALEAVLADLARRGVSRVVHLGDGLAGPLDPAGTADLLDARGIVGVRGNDDRALLDPGNAGQPTWDYVTPRLTARHRAWLRALPPTLALPEGVLLCHGTPRSDETALVEVPTADGGVLRPVAELAAELAGVAQPVVLCGHSHVPRTVAVPGGRWWSTRAASGCRPTRPTSRCHTSWRAAAGTRATPS